VLMRSRVPCHYCRRICRGVPQGTHAKPPGNTGYATACKKVCRSLHGPWVCRQVAEKHAEAC